METRPGRRYQVVLRGELGDQFGVAFEGMRLERRAGTTVLTGVVRDQAALVGLVERVQDLGLELVSIQPADAAEDADESPGVTGATHGAGPGEIHVPPADDDPGDGGAR
jgi:hypothetical protein